MRLIKLIVPAVLFAGLALLPSHANAQTMGEYASATAGLGTGGGSMGTSLGPQSIDNNGGGSSTWGASGLGASFEDRAGAASQSGTGGDFESRAGGSTGGSTSESRWPGSQLGSGGTADRFGGSSDRFSTENRFGAHTELSSSADRFPPGGFNDNRAGLDTSFNHSGLDTSGQASGLDTSSVPINY